MCLYNGRGEISTHPSLPSSSIFSFRPFWNSKLRNTAGTWTRVQNLVKIGSPGTSGRTPKFWPYVLDYPFLGRPVPEGLIFYCWCFFLLLFLSPRDLRAASADRRETLPHDRNLGALYNASPKIRGLPQRNWGPKTCKIWANFIQLQTSIANISGKGQDIQNRKDVITCDSSRVPWKKAGELRSRVLHVTLDPPKLNFSTDYISARRVCWPLKFLHALEINQGLLAHPPSRPPHVGLCPIFLVSFWN